MALSDFLDGYIARKTKKTTKLGALLDSIADKLTTIAIIILLYWKWNSCLDSPNFNLKGHNCFWNKNFRPRIQKKNKSKPTWKNKNPC